MEQRTVTEILLADIPPWYTNLLAQVGADNEMLQKLLEDSPTTPPWLLILSAAKSPHLTDEIAHKLVEHINSDSFKKDEKEHLIINLITNQNITTEPLTKINYTEHSWLHELLQNRNLNYLQLKTLLDKSSPQTQTLLIEQILKTPTTPPDYIEQLTTTHQKPEELNGWLYAAGRNDLTKTTLQWVENNLLKNVHMLAGWCSRDDTTYEQIVEITKTIKQNPTRLLLVDFEQYNWISLGIKRKNSIDAKTWIYATETFYIKNQNRDQGSWIEQLMVLDKTICKNIEEQLSVLECVKTCMQQPKLQNLHSVKNNQLLQTIYDIMCNTTTFDHSTADKVVLQKWAKDHQLNTSQKTTTTRLKKPKQKTTQTGTTLTII